MLLKDEIKEYFKRLTPIEGYSFEKLKRGWLHLYNSEQDLQTEYLPLIVKGVDYDSDRENFAIF